MVSTLFQSPIFSEIILPFILIFTVIFAILEKAKILGEDKKQIDAIVSFAIALIFVSYSYATGVISKLMPFLGISAVVILVFMILFAFVSTGKEGFELGQGLKITFGVLIGIGVVIVVIWATGAWDKVYSFFSGSDERTTTLWATIFVVIAIIVAVVVAFKGGGPSTPAKTGG